ncbi:ferredoxin [Kitasatospora aureofaciens]|uniref:ferredoxin n=1 Tax=Kitasatospora aureofaciens TaxID=1894 RepID=UPI0037CCA8C1
MGVDVNRDVCTGAGQCTLIAPQLFDQDDEDGLVVLLRQPGAADDPDVRRAVSVCPSRALRLS